MGEAFDDVYNVDVMAMNVLSGILRVLDFFPCALSTYPVLVAVLS